MADQVVRLKVLLRQKHWQTYRTFCAEYDQAARAVDKALIGTWPSRTQLHRWMAGELKGLPYPDHCRILEAMLPPWSAEQLFELCSVNHDGFPGRAAADEMSDLVAAIDDGLNDPDSASPAWGVDHGKATALETAAALTAPVSAIETPGADEAARELARRLLTLRRVLRLSSQDAARLAALAGNVIELDMKVDIDIGSDGWAQLSYRHDLLNLTSRPLSRIIRELWFENTRGPLDIAPVNDEMHQGDDERMAGPSALARHARVAIQRIHDTATMAKFACQVSSPIQPGERAVIRYTCEGGQFVGDHYWRQSLQRYTREFTMTLRHRGAASLVTCAATEEHPDGSENSAAEELLWDCENGDVVITLARDYLRPGQAVTLRWEVHRGSA